MRMMPMHDAEPGYCVRQAGKRTVGGGSGLQQENRRRRIRIAIRELSAEDPDCSTTVGGRPERKSSAEDPGCALRCGTESESGCRGVTVKAAAASRHFYAPGSSVCSMSIGRMTGMDCEK